MLNDGTMLSDAWMNEVVLKGRGLFRKSLVSFNAAKLEIDGQRILGCATRYSVTTHCIWLFKNRLCNRWTTKENYE